MLSSLCPVLAVISPVSRFCVTPVGFQNPVLAQLMPL